MGTLRHMNFSPCLFHRNFYIFGKNSDTLYFSLCLSGQITFNLIVNEDGKYPRATDYIAQTCRQQETEKVIHKVCLTSDDFIGHFT